MVKIKDINNQKQFLRLLKKIRTLEELSQIYNLPKHVVGIVIEGLKRNGHNIIVLHDDSIQLVAKLKLSGNKITTEG
jgi:chemotaxis protein CheY-P-specific phosphatase CheC